MDHQDKKNPAIARITEFGVRVCYVIQRKEG